MDSVEEVSAKLVQKIRDEAGGMLGVNWPHAEAITRDVLRAWVHDMLAEIDDGDDEAAGPGRYL